MIRKIWKIELDGAEHVVQLEQGFFATGKNIRLDGVVLKQDVQQRRSWLGEGEFEFAIDGHVCLVIVRTNGLVYSYDMAVDGVSVDTGKRVASVPPVPTWAWIFVVACGVIPLVAGFGALPVLLGFGGAVFCAITARDAQKTMRQKLVTCVVITVGAWLLFGLLVAAAFSMAA